MDKTALKAFLQDRLIAYDPTLDVDDGSAVDIEVIQPLLTALGPSPLDYGTYEYVRERISHFFGGEVIDEADALADTSIKPLAHLIDPLIMEIERIKTQQSVRDPRLLTEESAQALGANFYVSMEQGTHTTGTVRLYYRTPRSDAINTSTTMTSIRGDVFVPTGRQTITQAEMLGQRSNGYYYWDISVRSLKPGRISVGVNEIADIQGVDAAVRVTNLRAFRTGQPKESVATFVDRVLTALTERSLVTGRGATARLRELFSTIRAVEVSGFGDIEMGRDAISYKLSGARAQVYSSQNISFPLYLAAGINDLIWVDADNGAGGWTGVKALQIPGTYNNLLSLVYAINVAWMAAGGQGLIASGWGSNRLLLHSWSDIPNGNYTYEESGIQLHTPPVRSAWASLGFSATQLDILTQGSGGLLLSSMPGGILRPNTAYGTYAPDREKTFHIGGATDIYIQPAAYDEQALLLVDTEDARPAWLGTMLSTHPTVASSDRVRDAASNAANARGKRPDFTQVLNQTGLDLPGEDTSIFDRQMMFGRKVEPGDILSIYSGDAADTYVVAATPNTDTALSASDLRLNRTISAAPETGLTYRLSKAFSMPLHSPTRRVKISQLHGYNLYCTGASTEVSWLPSSQTPLDTTAFSRYGVRAGDVLKIWRKTNGKTSLNYGEYTVISVSGLTAKLDVAMQATELVCFTVSEPIRDEIQLPFTRIKRVDILDDAGTRTGKTVPPALPVLVQSRGIQGALIKMSGKDGALLGSDPFGMTIPTTGRKFTTYGLVVGDAVSLYHPTAFGEKTKINRRVAQITNHEIKFDLGLDIPVGLSVTDVKYVIGRPSEGTARMYFQEPISFELQRDWNIWTPPGAPSSLFTSTDVATFSSVPTTVEDDETRFIVKDIGVHGGMRVYPAADIGEVAEQRAMSVDLYPTFAQDMTPRWSTIFGNQYPRVSFSEFVSRQHQLKPHNIVSQVMGDVFMISSERHLGIGSISSFTSAAAAEMDWYHRQLFSIGRISPETAQEFEVVPDAFNNAFSFAARGLTDSSSTTNNVEGVYGQLEGCLFSIHSTPEDEDVRTRNTGTSRVLSAIESATGRSRRVRLTNPEIEQRSGLQPHAPLAEKCGRATWDQVIITVGAGAGDYVVGEQVTNGSVTLRVGYWDSAGSKIYAWGKTDETMPASGNWVGGQSATTRAHVSYATSIYAKPTHGDKVLTFSGGVAAPGWFSDSERGAWVPDNVVYLYGLYNSTPTADHYVAARVAMGEWRIVSINSTGTQVTLENVLDSSKVFDNQGLGNVVEVGWVIGTAEHVADRFSVYDVTPTPFSLNAVIYEEGGVIKEGEVELWDPGLSLQDYSTGRLFCGYRCPYQIVRPGRYRISATEMERNQEDGLYYADLPVESLGPETSHNLPFELDMRFISSPCPVRGAWVAEDDSYLFEGYVLEVRDPAMSFSRNEQIMLVSSPRVLPFGSEDISPNKTVLDSVSLSVLYDFAGIVGEIDAVVQSDTERVTAASLMARCFTPIYLRTAISYAGDADSSDLQTDVEEHVDDLTGSDRVEVSDLEGLLHRRGVDFIDQNFALVGMLHDQKRNWYAYRSRNYIGGDEESLSRRWASHRTSHFVVDQIVFTKI